MERHLLDPVGSESVADVVRRLGAVLSMDESLAELAVRTRRQASRPGELATALVVGSVIKVFAFRGSMHYLFPGDGGIYLARLPSRGARRAQRRALQDAPTPRAVRRWVISPPDNDDAELDGGTEPESFTRKTTDRLGCWPVTVRMWTCNDASWRAGARSCSSR